MDASGAIDRAGRPALYALAARLFAAEVDAALFRRLAAPELDALLCPTGLVLVEPELREVAPPKALEELAVEYCRLFVGPRAECPPYASAHRGGALLGGRQRAGLEAFMERHGLELADEGARIASTDHLAVELSILACLHDGEAVQILLRDHLLPWAPRYLRLLEECASRALYRSLARLTAALLEEDRAARDL